MDSQKSITFSDKKYSLELDNSEFLLLIKGLYKLPYEESAQLINKLFLMSDNYKNSKTCLDTNTNI